jgi:hypothetical protein
MNALEILGVACVDARFRKRLFADVEGVIKDNRADLTWAEEAGLRRITGKFRPPRPKASTASLSNGPLEPSKEEPNTLEDELADVGVAIAKMCPEEPCPWPAYFTQYEK